MQAAPILLLTFGRLLLPFLFFCLALPPLQAHAQDSGYSEPSEKYSSEELAQMLAPVALYPDVLLSQILMASTYPIEVIEADRWVKGNPQLKDARLDAELLDKDWDPSVKAICHFPSILALMSEKITETTNLGNAFLAQEADVMDMVQELRAKAYAQGNLTTTAQQKVIVEKETIIIEPEDPTVIYVPYYDPFSIYGPWWYPAYPPYYWGPPGIPRGVGLYYWPGFYFGFAFGTWSSFDWHRHYIFINSHRRPRYVRHVRWITKPGHWDHVPRHRRGVAYRDKSTAIKYGQYTIRSRTLPREIRGFPELPALQEKRRVNDRTKIDRARQEREQAERDRQVRQQAERKRQEQVRTERQRLDRERVERDRRMRQQAERKRQEQVRTERQGLDRERVERDRQMRQRAGQGGRKRQQVDREQQQRSRDNVFNQVEDGSRERQSSERGRFSRQGAKEGQRGRGPSDDNDRGHRGNRNRPQ